MFAFQRAFTNESVAADVFVLLPPPPLDTYLLTNIPHRQAVRTVRYKRGLLDGEHSNYKARVQLWREQNVNQSLNGDSSSKAGSIAGTFRSRPAKSSVLKVHSTRLVMYLDEIIMTLFGPLPQHAVSQWNTKPGPEGLVTDDIAIEAKTRNRCLRIRPSSHKTFGNPSAVKACVIGNRDISGGIRLDMEGLLIDDQEGFDEFKWFEIDFQNMEGMFPLRSRPTMWGKEISLRLWNRDAELSSRLYGGSAGSEEGEE